MPALYNDDPPNFKIRALMLKSLLYGAKGPDECTKHKSNKL